MLAKLVRERMEFDIILSNLHKCHAPINSILARKTYCKNVKEGIDQFTIAYRRLDTIIKNNGRVGLQINPQVKKHAKFILTELDQLNVYYCIENIHLLTHMLFTTTLAILNPNIDYSEQLNPIADKVIGHPAPQLKKIGYCLRILLGVLAIGAGVTLGFFTAGLGFAPCFFATQFGFISFFQGIGGLYGWRQRGLSKAIANTTNALENSRPVQPKNTRIRGSIDKEVEKSISAKP